MHHAEDVNISPKMLDIETLGIFASLMIITLIIIRMVFQTFIHVYIKPILLIISLIVSTTYDSGRKCGKTYDIILYN